MHVQGMLAESTAGQRFVGLWVKVCAVVAGTASCSEVSYAGRQVQICGTRTVSARPAREERWCSVQCVHVGDGSRRHGSLARERLVVRSHIELAQIFDVRHPVRAAGAGLDNILGACWFRLQAEVAQGTYHVEARTGATTSSGTQPKDLAGPFDGATRCRYPQRAAVLHKARE